MFAGDIVQLTRSLLDDLQGGTGQRFSDSTILLWTNTNQRKLIRSVMFPPGRCQIYTAPNQQEYQIQGVLIRPDSVYLDGQLIVPVDSIATLEGQQIGFYDQGYRQSNPPPAAATEPYTTGSGLPASTLGPFAPSWGTLTPQGYPISVYGSWPAPSAEPSFPRPLGQRARFYTRGGYIGVTPAPANGPPVDPNGNPIPNFVVDGIFLPPNVTSIKSPMIFPDNFDQALAWANVLFGKFSDDTDKTSESRNFAQAMYKDSVIDCRMFVQSIKGNATQGPKVSLSRGLFANDLRKFRSRSGGYP